MTLTVEPDGATTLVWIDRAFCDEESVPPCDPPEIQTIAENWAEIAFHRVTGSTAYGNVVSSTDPHTLAEGEPIWLTRLPYGMVSLLRFGNWVGQSDTAWDPTTQILSPLDAQGLIFCSTTGLDDPAPPDVYGGIGAPLPYGS